MIKPNLPLWFVAYSMRRLRNGTPEAWQLLAACLSLILCTSQVTPAEVTMMDGSTHQGAILSVTNEQVKLSRDGKELILKASDVLAVELSTAGAKPPTNSHSRLQLRDGTALLASSFRGRGDRADLTLHGGLNMTVPWKAMQTALLQAHLPEQAQAFEELLKPRPQNDLLWLLSRDGQNINTFQGNIGNPSQDGSTLQFQTTEGRDANIPWDRLRGLYFKQAKQSAQTPVCKVIDKNGNIFAVKELATKQVFIPLAGDFHLVQMRGPDGWDMEIPLSTVLSFDFSPGKVLYLSEMEPLRIETASILEERHPGFRRNQNLFGRPIRLGGKVYAKGLATRSRLVLDFDVNGYNLFQSLIGIDDDMGGTANAVVRIEGDGRELFSTVITRRDVKPKEVELRIANVSRLRLIVDFGEDFDLGDHVDFANARILK